MRAGTLRERIHFERPSQTPAESPAWSPTTTWTEFASCWAEVTPQPVAEAIENGTVQSGTRYTIKTRFVANVRPEHRIKVRGRILNIVSTADVAGRGRELEIVATEHHEAEVITNG